MCQETITTVSVCIRAIEAVCVCQETVTTVSVCIRTLEAVCVCARSGGCNSN